MRLRGVIDCLIPRGGPSLIDDIVEHATVPYVIDGDGNCHVYVDRSADLDMACVSSSTPRPSGPASATPLSPCSSTATWPTDSWPLVAPALEGVELRGDDETRAILGPDRVVGGHR